MPRRFPTRARQRRWTFGASGIGGAIVAIGNAPTALFRLLGAIDEGAPKPALILGLPVGFVGAAESKAELAANPRGVPFITVKGRRGGSAMAAAAVNALCTGWDDMSAWLTIIGIGDDGLERSAGKPRGCCCAMRRLIIAPDRLIKTSDYPGAEVRFWSEGFQPMLGPHSGTARHAGCAFGDR